MGRSSLRHAFVLMLVAPAVAAAQPGDAPVADEPAWSHDVGLLLEVTIDRARPLVAYDPSTGAARESPTSGGALFAGYQGRRWSFGVGLELARTVDHFEDNFSSGDFTASTFGIVPGLRVALGSASDGRAELVGIVDLGLGETRFTQTGVEDYVYQRAHLQFGPGIRYWLARSVAIGASGLIRHDRLRHEEDDPFNGNTRVSETTNTDLVTSVNLAGVF